MTAGVTSAGYGVTCPHCGLDHKTTCPRISAIEYDEDGGIKRVEFHGPQPLVLPSHLLGPGTFTVKQEKEP